MGNIPRRVRFDSWLISWAMLFDLIVEIISFGFLHPDWGLTLSIDLGRKRMKKKMRELKIREIERTIGDKNE